MINGLCWHVREDGAASSPPLLLLHGFTGCTAFWDDVVEILQHSFRCIRVDLPGHGRTETPATAEACTLESVSQSLAVVLDRCDVARTHLWGYSMGGRLALYAALAFPDRFDRLILESASPGIADPVERVKRHQDDERLADSIERDGVATFVDRWMSQPLFIHQTKMPPAKQAQARSWRLANSAAGLATCLRGMGAGAQKPLYSRLPELGRPTLLLVGEHDAKYRAIAAMMEKSLPRATGRVIRDCGHAPDWEKPESCATAVNEFLSGVNETEPSGHVLNM
ncbi:MAG: 2-succinyl-6-hydroxy-2,4-cyclohexadiene-1-carboxylate synthase [candidate division Zixibacteria bacterium]|nr:2-succinyl-6-hydroxy-2,4-cyclohexadiene-1-carboxylate synthase [candidate division Zixibacteria bacterium]